MENETQPASGFDLTKLLGEYKLPGVDMGALVASQRKNVEALVSANRLAYEGVQAVARRQAEILRQVIEESAGAAKELAEVGTPQERAARQTELTREAFERSLANMRELAEMVARSNSEAVDLLNKRIAESLDEWRDQLRKN